MISRNVPLGQQKEDVPHGIIPDCSKGSMKTSTAAYCLKDASLPLRLVSKTVLSCELHWNGTCDRRSDRLFNWSANKLRCFPWFYEDADVQISSFRIQTWSNANRRRLWGATVIEPKAYYTVPVRWIFASLYPSIIQAYNLCFQYIGIRPG
jgi:DNA polymerase delta subunit 1